MINQPHETTMGTKVHYCIMKTTSFVKNLTKLVLSFKYNSINETLKVFLLNQ